MDRAQRNYSTGEREAWAIVVATRRWRKYLQAADQVIIWSDHNPLESLRKQKDPRGKFARWILELEPLNYIIRFRRGLDNLAADRLSRSATQYDFTVNDETEFFERHVYTILEDTKIQIFSIDSTAFTGKLLREQARDPIIRDAIEQLNLTRRVEKGQLKKHSGLCLKNGLLYRRKRIIVPTTARRSVLDLVHNAFYVGMNRTYEEVKSRFYWKGLYTDVVNICESCTICLETKRPGHVNNH